jgi:HEAT repeat protein
MEKRQVTTGIVLLLMAILPFSLMAQDMSVEDVYLQQSAEIQVIRDLSSDNSRDLKTIALDYIGEMVDRGAANDEVRRILAELTLDGVQNQVRLNGRVINNFPDLRIRAINYLAQLGTPEAKDSLINILESSLQASNVQEDPSVVTAAIKGLSKIGLSDNGDTLRSINATFLRYNLTKPDNSLAQAVIAAIDSFIDKGIRDEGSISVLMMIQANYEYIKHVRDNASAVIAKLREI